MSCDLHSYEWSASNRDFRCNVCGDKRHHLTRIGSRWSSPALSATERMRSEKRSMSTADQQQLALSLRLIAERDARMEIIRRGERRTDILIYVCCALIVIAAVLSVWAAP